MGADKTIEAEPHSSFEIEAPCYCPTRVAKKQWSYGVEGEATGSEIFVVRDDGFGERKKSSKGIDPSVGIVSYTGAYVRVEEAEAPCAVGQTKNCGPKLDGQIVHSTVYNWYKRAEKGTAEGGSTEASAMFLIHSNALNVWEFVYNENGDMPSAHLKSGMRATADPEDFGDPERAIDWSYGPNAIATTVGSITAFNLARHVYAESYDEKNKENPAELLDGTVWAPTTADLEDIMMTDSSGAPAHFEVEQRRGHMMFSFTDASMCESEFSVTRQEITSEGAFTKKEAYSSFVAAFRPDAARKCGSHSSPGPSVGFTDNLLVNGEQGERVKQGKWFRYCMQAVATSAVGMKAYNSNCAEASVLVEWEASITGTVLTKVGSAPVSGCRVEGS
jgi:hypothetical protein